MRRTLLSLRYDFSCHRVNTVMDSASCEITGCSQIIAKQTIANQVITKQMIVEIIEI